MLDKKFELVISLGESCSCATYLKKYKHRDYSYPFDWLYNVTFEKKINLIVHDFEGFLLKENLRGFPVGEKAGGSKYDYYEDSNTELRFLHDFPKGMQLDEAYAEVYAKYQRRIARLYEKTAQAKDVLFVWFSLSAVVSPETIVKAQHSLSEKFKKGVNVLVIENDSSLESIQDEKYSDFATKVRGPFDTGKGLDYSETNLVDTVFSRIKGKKKYSHAISRILKRILCWVVPSRKLRRKLRDA